MRVAGLEPIELVLRGGGRVGGEPGVDASNRRAVPEKTLLRQPEDGGADGRRSQAGAAADATDGPGGDLPQAASVAKPEGTPDLPVLAAKCEDRAARPGVVQRYH